MKTNKQRNRKNKKKQNLDDGLRAAPNAMLGIPRRFDRVMPDRLVTRLSYRGLANFTIAAAGTAFSRRWTPTSVYDVDPLLGSTATVGFSELSAFYGSYRCYKSKLVARFCNTSSTTPMLGVIIPLNNDPGATPALGTIQEWQNNPYSKDKLIPVAGGPSITLSQNMSTEKIYGSKMVYFDDNFSSPTNAVPLNNWWWAIAVIAASPVASAQTCMLEICIEMDIEFYDRKVLLN